MPLDTQTFALSRYWLSTALTSLPARPTIFSAAELRQARQLFLAGKNQLTSIRNWLDSADIIQKGHGKTILTDFGKSMAAHDPKARNAWTWWAIHARLASNPDAFPYSTFFTEFAPDGQSWLTIDQIEAQIHACIALSGQTASSKSIHTYFEGLDNAFRPNEPLYGLQLIERRPGPQNALSRPLIRRTVSSPHDKVVAYATLLVQSRSFASRTTIETRDLINAGLGRIIGMPDKLLRDSLDRIHRDRDLSKLLQYRKTVNLDSVQFLRKGSRALLRLCNYIYETNGVR